MAKSKGLATIEGFADECVMTGNRENVLRIRMLDGSFAGDVAVDVLLRLLNRKNGNATPPSKPPAQTRTS